MAIKNANPYEGATSIAASMQNNPITYLKSES